MCTCAACFPSPPTSLFSPVVLRLRTTLLLSRTLLSSPDDAAVSSRPPPSRTSPPPAADGLPATVLLRQLLPAHEALTHRLEGLLRGMRVRLIIWDFCLYCCGSILMRYCFSPSPLFFNIMVGVSVVGWRGSLVPALPQRSTAITSSNSCCGSPRELHQ